MAPGTKTARLIFHSGFSCYLGDFTLRNVIANLAQNVKPRACWLDCFVFHPCRVAGSKGQANTFSLFLWDGCVRFTFVDFDGLCSGCLLFIAGCSTKRRIQLSPYQLVLVIGPSFLEREEKKID